MARKSEADKRRYELERKNYETYPLQRFIARGTQVVLSTLLSPPMRRVGIALGSASGLSMGAWVIYTLLVVAGDTFITSGTAVLFMFTYLFAFIGFAIETKHTAVGFLATAWAPISIPIFVLWRVVRWILTGE